MILFEKSLSHYSIEDVMLFVKKQFPNSVYDFKKHRITLLDAHGDGLGFIRLPLHVCFGPELGLLDDSQTVLYLSIEAGNAAICVVEDDVLTYHTTFSAYMTRKKQGFSQVKYLNKKGKSRAGSRVRLSSTIEFFENINSNLEELFEETFFDRIALDCTPTLLPYLFDSKVKCPFEKGDNRTYKIPLHIDQSNFTCLSKAIKKLSNPTVFYEEKYDDSFKAFV